MLPIDEYKFDLSKPLNETYKLVKFIFAGRDGAVFHIQNKNTGFNLALKIIPTCRPILLAVDQFVASKSNLFVRCYGVFVATKIPPQWMKQIIQNSPDVTFENSLFYGYFYEHSGIDVYTWLLDKKAILERDALAVLFEVFYANCWARKLAGFSHGDLHVQNVLLKPYKAKREYQIAGKKFIIDTPFIVQIIDFDRSSVRTKTSHFMTGREQVLEKDAPLAQDLLFFIETFAEALTERFQIEDGPQLFSDMVELLKDETRIENIEKIFLLPSFDEFVASVKESKQKRLKTTNCHICGGVAVRALENRHSLKFCADDECVLKLGEIAHMI